MEEKFIRTEILLGRDKLNKIQNSKILVFGVGGVGGFAIEALVRSGIKAIDIVDRDIVTISNLNRQLIATLDTIGRPKVEVMFERAKSINDKIKMNTYEMFYLPDTADTFDFKNYDYIIDAVDTISAKIEIIKRAKESNVKVISAMGAGNRISPRNFKVDYIENTKVCKLAKVMRKELKDRGIKKVKVVYSDEKAVVPMKLEEDKGKRKKTPGSISYAPAICGMMIAGEVISDLMEG